MSLARWAAQHGAPRSLALVRRELSYLLFPKNLKGSGQYSPCTHALKKTQRQQLFGPLISYRWPVPAQSVVPLSHLVTWKLCRGSVITLLAGTKVLWEARRENRKAT